MNIKGDIANNWEFFKQQWNNNEVATSLEAQNDKVRRAASWSVMGKDFIEIFLNLKLSKVERNSVSSCLMHLKLAYFSPKRNVVYKPYFFNTCTQNVEESV